ncbi:hypothetical protein VNO78_14626 [Psophocarpus tetragonolobus]|uniref:Uncharacterized protein n=1 Tax=Psophocarpus tetragonolobus TaxID=3891 RepID=A0AAN9XIF4_PSOTE
MHDYPLSIVEHVGFRRFVVGLQPLFQVPARNTIKKDIFCVYDFGKDSIMKLLDANDGRVAITSDIWTASNQKKGFMAVTAHFINSSWILQSHVLRFIYIPAPHTAEKLCHALVDCSKVVEEAATVMNEIESDDDDIGARSIAWLE